MSVKEVTFLRKNGQLDEAFQLASAELQSDPTNEWAQMSMFWVLRDFCLKRYLPQNNREALQKALNQMEELLPTMMDDEGVGARAFENLSLQVLPGAKEITEANALSKTDAVAAYNAVKDLIPSLNSDSPVLAESLGWIIYRYLKVHSQALASMEIRRLLRDYMQLKNTRPSMLHSSILIFAMNFSKEHHDFNFYRFFMMWGPQLLRFEDYLPSTFEGKEIPPMVARICRTLVNSGDSFDYLAFRDSLNERFRSHVADWMCEAAFWTLYHLHTEGNKRVLFDSFVHYAQQFSLAGPSHWHSEILRLALRCMTDTDSWRFIPFFQAWDYNNLQPSDWKEETDEQGHVYKCLAMKAAKKCFESVKESGNKSADILQWLDGLYDVVVAHVDNDEWSNRNRAMIYVWMKDYGRAIKAYRHLVLELNEKYYVWNEMAACVDQPQLKIALYCKALSLERNENFLGEIRLNLSETLVAEGFFVEAATELSVYKRHRDKEGKKVTSHYMRIANIIPPSAVTMRKDNNKELYTKYIPSAEEFAFADVESHLCVLARRWEKDGKIRCMFVDTEGNTFTTSARTFFGLAKLPLGTVFSVKYSQLPSHGQTEGNDMRLHPLTLHRQDRALWSVLPLKFGYIDSVNTEKKCIHICSEDSHSIFHFYSGSEHFAQHDMVSYIEYREFYKGEWYYKAANMSVVTQHEGLSHFRVAEGVVDNVNNGKHLFHFVANDNQIEGVVFYNETQLRPSYRDKIRIHYCFRKNKEGNTRVKAVHVELK